MKNLRKIQNKLARARVKLLRQEQKISKFREVIAALEVQMGQELELLVKANGLGRRGRPRKLLAKPVVKAKDATPRRRGRPPKVVGRVSKSVLKNKGKGVKPAGRRGRPPKNK